MKLVAKKLYQAFGYSLDGLKAALEHEMAVRLEIFMMSLLIPVALIFGHTGMEKALLIASLILVFIVELINSAIEAAIDRVSLDKHELSKRAKDLGSAAVLIACINVVIIWSLVFFF